MTAGFRGIPDADALARAAEVFVLVWSSMPPELPEKISASQLRALVAVQRRGVTTVTALARDLAALPSSATRLCDRLVAAGYLDRTPDATNRRFHAVRLTPAGERLLEVLQDHRSDALAAVMARMDARSVEQLLSGLAAFAAEAGASGDRSGPPDGSSALRPATVARRSPSPAAAACPDDVDDDEAEDVEDDGPPVPRANLA